MRSIAGGGVEHDVHLRASFAASFTSGRPQCTAVEVELLEELLR